MSRSMPVLAVLAAAVIAGCGSSGSSSSGSSSSSGTASASSSSSSSSASTATSSSAPPSTSSAPTHAPKPSSHLSLSEREFRITPSISTVARTGTIAITVRNRGTVTHAFAIEGPSGLVRTADIAPGGSATLTIAIHRAGRYAFFCPIDGHIRLGMHGVLIVGHPSSGGGGPPVSTPTTPGGGGGIYH